MFKKEEVQGRGPSINSSQSKKCCRVVKNLGRPRPLNVHDTGDTCGKNPNHSKRAFKHMYFSLNFYREVKQKPKTV